jgi:hypothetical protein
VDRLIHNLDDPYIWEGTIADVVDDPKYCINYHASTSLRFDSYHVVASYEDFFVDEGNYGATLSMTMQSFKQSGNGTYQIWIGDKHYEVFMPGAFLPVTIPIMTDDSIETLRIVSTHASGDFMIVSDLRLYKSELPSDLLYAVKRGIERWTNFNIPIGEVTVSEGDRDITFNETWEYLEHNLVARLGNRKYLMQNVVENTASLGYLYDGCQILENFSGQAKVEVPVEVGYYDREVVLPGIVLWYNSPQPTERNAVTYQNWCIVNGKIITIRSFPFERWKVNIEVVARSPQLVAQASAAVRQFLSHYVVWLYGERLNFNWTEPTLDTDPVESYDLVPRAMYSFELELKEKLWEGEIKQDMLNRNLSVAIQH